MMLSKIPCHMWGFSPFLFQKQPGFRLCHNIKKQLNRGFESWTQAIQRKPLQWCAISGCSMNSPKLNSVHLQEWIPWNWLGLLTLTIKVTFRLLLGVPRHCELHSCATLPINSPIPIFLCAARLQDPSAMLNRAQSLYSVCSHTLGIAEPGNHCAWHPVTLHQNDVILCFIFIFLQGLYVAIIPRFRFLRRAQLVSNACAMPIIFLRLSTFLYMEL